MTGAERITEPDADASVIAGRHLFLKGRSGIGKTTCLLSCLEPVWKGAGGFFTQRLVDEDGATAGFRLVPVEGMDSPPSVTARYAVSNIVSNTVRDTVSCIGSSVFSNTAPCGLGRNGIFIERTPEGWKKYPEIFETLGAEILDRLLENPEKYRFCYLDEIGGIELGAAPFMERLERLLRGPIPCIGVVKAPGNLTSMGTRVSLSEGAAKERDGLERRLAEEFGSRILDFTDAEAGAEEIRCFLERKLAGEKASGKGGRADEK